MLIEIDGVSELEELHQELQDNNIDIDNEGVFVWSDQTEYVIEKLIEKVNQIIREVNKND